LVFPKPDEPVPHISASQMAEVDRLATETYHIGLIQLMENAGRNLASLARSRFLQGDPRGHQVTILAGSGGNGGGALVCARHLTNLGATVRVFLSRPATALGPVPARQLEILERMGVPHSMGSDLFWGATSPALVIDGLIGYSLEGAPRAEAAEWIRWANRQRSPILALDIPSGMDASTGRIFDPAIRATATLTLALPKNGLLVPGADVQVGDLYLGDIGIPPVLYAEPSLDLRVGPIFARSEIVALK
jgi:NAD(P)H-hydrate epimerase